MYRSHKVNVCTISLSASETGFKHPLGTKLSCSQEQQSSAVVDLATEMQTSHRALGMLKFRWSLRKLMKDKYTTICQTQRPHLLQQIHWVANVWQLSIHVMLLHFSIFTQFLFSCRGVVFWLLLETGYWVALAWCSIAVLTQTQVETEELTKHSRQEKKSQLDLRLIQTLIPLLWPVQYYKVDLSHDCKISCKGKKQ